MPSMHWIATTLASALLCGAGVRAEDPLPSVERLTSSPVLRHLKPNPIAHPPRTGPEKTVAQMYVPEGFRVDLVVGEPDLHQPVAFAWDDRGRIWVVEAYSYPTKRPVGQGLDKIVILEDRDGDGRFESRTVFAEGLNLVSGLEVGYGGVWVGAAPQLLFIPDADRDDRPDGPPKVLLEGFGFQDTHECLNSFLWGPDGWLYGNQGVFNYSRIGKPGAPESELTELRAGVWRYHPVRHEFEVFASGGSNPWGLDYDETGQIFMTHCRSYWGKGLTTHVIQGGHYWNQANANYAPYIVAEPPPEFPGYRNYLLASARYDHGAGGAGVRGSDAIYGGHSHVGTLIYQGDNWPEEYRGRLFTHNLGGHQINQQVNRPLGSGFDTVHAGRDLFFCSDPKYVAVDLQTGPDGAVYFIDWYDQQHCHNPNTERWDRSNGRIYRMSWQATYQPVTVALGGKSDDELVALLNHKNAWHGRMARRLLAERAAAGKAMGSTARATLESMAGSKHDARQRVQALWALHAAGLWNEALAKRALLDSEDSIRAWAIQLSTDSKSVSAGMADRFVALANTDPSPVVRRYLASAVQRLPDSMAWPLIEALARRGEDHEDRNVPWLLWHGMAQRMPGQVERALTIAESTPIPGLADWIHWYAATLGGDALERVVAALAEVEGEALRRRVSGLWLAMEPRANVSMPKAWKAQSARLQSSGDPRLRQLADQLAAAFGDHSGFSRLRAAVIDVAVELGVRKHAFGVLSRALDRESLPAFLKLVDDPAFRSDAIRWLARYDSPEIPRVLLAKIPGFTVAERAEAIDTLTRRPAFAMALLDAVAAGSLQREYLGAYAVRQLTDLKNPAVDRRVVETWGRIGRSAAEKERQIVRMETVFNEAPLWAYDGRAGRQHFQKLCASCHVLGADGSRVGPELTGAGKHGIRYFLENIIDPNAVVGSDFQMTTLETQKGEVISGLVVADNASAVTVRTVVESVVVPKAEIQKRTLGERSLMPEGLLESLNDREQIELLKYLTSN